MKNVDGLIFRDSAVDENENVVCVLKWESLEKQEVFEKEFHKRMKNEPEIMEEFSKIVDITTMSKEKYNLI
jgi:isocitrate/isopropylmalate dehydrogenase